MPNEEEISVPELMWHQIKEEKPGPSLVELLNEQIIISFAMNYTEKTDSAKLFIAIELKKYKSYLG